MLSLSLELSILARTAGQEAPWICLSLPLNSGITNMHHHSLVFAWVLGSRTQVFMSHLLSPNLLFNVFIYSLIILYNRFWSYPSPPPTPTLFPYPLKFMFSFLKNKQIKYLHKKENKGVWFVLTNYRGAWGRPWSVVDESAHCHSIEENWFFPLPQLPVWIDYRGLCAHASSLCWDFRQSLSTHAATVSERVCASAQVSGNAASLKSSTTSTTPSPPAFSAFCSSLFWALKEEYGPTWDWALRSLLLSPCSPVVALCTNHHLL